MELSNWFGCIAKAVADVVDDCGGAVVMTKQQLVEAAQQVDAALLRCPEKVKEHVLCALPHRVGLRTVAFNYRHYQSPLRGTCGVVLVYDPKIHADDTHARMHCVREGLPGLSDEVVNELMEMGVVVGEVDSVAV